MNTMKRAHQIRKEAAEKWNCTTSEIIFSLCLRMAWTEKKESKMTEITKGSEKQIAWAKDIQKKALTEIEKSSDECDQDLLNEYKNKVETCEDAKWFIDYARHNDAGHIECWLEDVDEEEYVNDAKEALGF